MNYYEAWQDMDIEDQWFLSDPLDKDGNEIIGWKFTIGKEYPSSLPRPEFVKIKQKGTILPVSFGGLDVPYVNQSIKNALAGVCCGSIQFIPIRIEGIEFKYYIMNTLCLLDAVSNLSEIDYYKEDEWPEKQGEPKDIIKLVLDKGKIPKNIKIFRLNIDPGSIYVSEDVKKTIEITERLYGMNFEKLLFFRAVKYLLIRVLHHE